MKQSNLKLTAEIDPGTTIELAFAEAIAVASKLFVNVGFKFNDVECTAFPFGSIEIGVKEYHAAMQRRDKYKFAFARVEPLKS